MPHEFHARFSAVGKVYEYRIVNAPIVSPFVVRYAWHVSQPLDDSACVIEPTHIGVAGGETAMRQREAWVLLDREEELRHGLTEAPAGEMRGAYYKDRRADADAGTEAQRGFGMLDRDVGLARPQPECAADKPAAREFGLTASARSTNAIMAPMSSPK